MKGLALKYTTLMVMLIVALLTSFVTANAEMPETQTWCFEPGIPYVAEQCFEFNVEDNMLYASHSPSIMSSLYIQVQIQADGSMRMLAVHTMDHFLLVETRIYYAHLMPVSRTIFSGQVNGIFLLADEMGMEITGTVSDEMHFYRSWNE